MYGSIGKEWSHARVDKSKRIYRFALLLARERGELTNSVTQTKRERERERERVWGVRIVV